MSDLAASLDVWAAEAVRRMHGFAAAPRASSGSAASRTSATASPA